MINLHDSQRKGKKYLGQIINSYLICFYFFSPKMLRETPETKVN